MLCFTIFLFKYIPEGLDRCQRAQALSDLSEFICKFLPRSIGHWTKHELDVQNMSASLSFRLSRMTDPLQAENQVDTLLSTLESADARTG